MFYYTIPPSFMLLHPSSLRPVHSLKTLITNYYLIPSTLCDQWWSKLAPCCRKISSKNEWIVFPYIKDSLAKLQRVPRRDCIFYRSLLMIRARNMVINWPGPFQTISNHMIIILLQYPSFILLQPAILPTTGSPLGDPSYGLLLI